MPRACRAGHCRLCFFIVIPGHRPGNPNQTNFLLVIAGLDPAIQVNHKANLFIWILGSSPRMTVLLYLSQKMLEQRGLRGTIPTTDRSGRCLWILGSSPRMTILQSTKSFTPPPEQRGLLSIVLSTCRGLPCRSSPDTLFFLLSSPDTLFFYCHPRASTRGSTLQSTKSFTKNVGASRPLQHNGAD